MLAEFFTLNLKNWVSLNLNFHREEIQNCLSCHLDVEKHEEYDENYMRPSESICHILQRRKDYEQTKKLIMQVIKN